MTCELARDLAAGYVLGALEPSEEAAVREHLRTCPQPHDEFAELGGVVPYLMEADLELVEPPASLRDRIMAAAAADLEDLGGASTVASPGVQPASGAGLAAPFPFPSAAERDARASARAGRIGWAMRVAAVVAIVALGGWNLVLQTELSNARRFDQAVASVISAAAQPGSQTVVLTPTDNNQASGIAAIRPDGSVVLAMRNLPATKGPEVYETWVIAGGGAPVPVGNFTVDANGTAAFTTRPTEAPPGAIVAVSREPQAGSTAPRGPIVSTGVGIAPST
jgi:anti-sigma-K factor RskA